MPVADFQDPCLKLWYRKNRITSLTRLSLRNAMPEDRDSEQNHKVLEAGWYNTVESNLF